MDMRISPAAALPPLAAEAVLKLLAVSKTPTRAADFADALPADTKPAMRLEGAAQAPALPVWPGVGRRIVPRGVPGRPSRKAPGFPKSFPGHGQQQPFFGE